MFSCCPGVGPKSGESRPLLGGNNTNSPGTYTQPQATSMTGTQGTTGPKLEFQKFIGTLSNGPYTLHIRDIEAGPDTPTITTNPLIRGSSLRLGSMDSNDSGYSPLKEVVAKLADEAGAYKFSTFHATPPPTAVWPSCEISLSDQKGINNQITACCLFTFPKDSDSRTHPKLPIPLITLVFKRVQKFVGPEEKVYKSYIFSKESAGTIYWEFIQPTFSPPPLYLEERRGNRAQLTSSASAPVSHHGSTGKLTTSAEQTPYSSLASLASTHTSQERLDWAETIFSNGGCTGQTPLAQNTTRTRRFQRACSDPPRPTQAALNNGTLPTPSPLSKVSKPLFTPSRTPSPFPSDCNSSSEED